MQKIIKFLKMPIFNKRFILREYLLMPLIRHQYGSFGKRSCIQKALMITGKKNIYIGNRVCIRPGARIEAVSTWETGGGKIQKMKPCISIGNRVDIEQNLHMTCAEKIVIEDNVTILSDVLITDINHSYQQTDLFPLEQELETGAVRIGQYSLIGSGARILPGVTIGKNVIIGANAVVTKDIPDYSIAAGVPAKPIKKYDFESGKWIKV